MKVHVLIIGLVSTAVAVTVLSTVDRAATDQKVGVVVETLPTSLDSLYPPNSKAPTYYLAMLKTGNAFSGIACDVLENDLANARANFESFKHSYLEISNMIPEWKERYPTEPLERLGAAIAGGEPAEIVAEVDEMGKVCHSCHVSAMAPVQQKYRWDTFAQMRITDPLSGQEVDYAQLMQLMQSNFTGIGNDVAQGQKENALKQFAGFNARFETMAGDCMVCHDSEREYYVDKSVVDMISNLQTELTKPEPEMSVVGGLLQSIGEESCMKCHLVHVPAAYAQQLMTSQ